MPAPVLHQAVVENLGQAIVDGVFAPGEALIIDDVMARLDVSRSVAREAVRVLETLGMVAMKRRVGNVVRPRSQWNVMDPRVIRWRLGGPHRDEELDQLMQLRAGLEPVAARLSATAAPDEVGPRLRRLAATMRALGEAGQGVSRAFLEADLEFHRLLVTSCGNDHLIIFSDTLAALLTERNQLGLLGDYPDPRAMTAHEALAEAVIRRDPAEAERASRDLVDVVHAEVLAPEQAPTSGGPTGQDVEAHADEVAVALRLPQAQVEAARK